MKVNYSKNNILALAVKGALIAMFTLPIVVMAEDSAGDETTALTRPTNSVELGIMNVSKDSAKFGEYNGLDKSGLYGIANINLRGGNTYDGGEGNTHWEVKGVDLGTTSRAVSGSITNQGEWNIGVGYDELRHNISDTYQTPQQGSMGGNNFTLPTTFGTLNGQARVLDGVQLGAFHTENVGTSRKNSSIGGSYTFSPQISFLFDYNHLDQSGAKLTAFGASAGPATLPSAGSWRPEAVAILMNPTNYKTDSINLALNWVGDKGHLTTSYFGSLFQNANNSLSWQNPMLSTSGATICASGGSCTYQTNTASTAPDNQFHQFNLMGGYTLIPSTKIAGGFSYGRNTQNDSFVTNLMQAGGLPKSSLDGLVINTHADFKLTNQATKDLTLTAGFKYNERDNQTASSTYKFINIAGVNDTVTSTPMSNRKTELQLMSDYRLTKNQKINIAYEHDWFKRWCNSYAIDGNNPAAAACAVSPSNSEDKLGLIYKLAASENLKFNFGYAYADRRASFDHTAVTPVGVTVGLRVINGADLAGFIPYFEASRTQNMLKAGFDWQASDRLSLGLKGKYAKDEYNDSTLGVQDGRTQGVNLDAAYSVNDQSTVTAYVSWQNRTRDLKSAQAASNVASSVTSLTALNAVVPLGVWTNRMEDNNNTVGINATRGGLMNGKLDVVADLSYAVDKTGYSTKVPYSGTCSTVALTCVDLPDISNKLVMLKFSGNYQLNKQGRVALGYIYQHLTSDDYFYNSYQYGYTPNRVMPTNQQSGSYSVNVVSATYIYTF